MINCDQTCLYNKQLCVLLRSLRILGILMWPATNSKIILWPQMLAPLDHPELVNTLLLGAILCRKKTAFNQSVKINSSSWYIEIMKNNNSLLYVVQLLNYKIMF